MLTLSITEQGTQKFTALLQSLKPQSQQKAYARALSRALQSMRQAAVINTLKEYYVRAADVRSAIRLIPSSGEMLVRGKRLGLEHYKVTPAKKPKRRRELLGAVKKSSGLKGLGRMFLVPRGSNKQPVFMRSGKARFPIERVSGPAVPQLIGHNDATIEAMTEAAKATFESRFRHEIMRELGVIT